MNLSIAKQKVRRIASSIGTSYLLTACTVAPILREFPPGTVSGGFVELDEFTDPRFYRDSVSAAEKIGTLYVTGGNAYVNGSRISKTMDFSNNAYVNTQAGSAVRIEFDQGNGACLIHIADFQAGQSYGNTTSCRYEIETPHADTQLQNSAYHFAVSPQQTEVTVLSGVATLTLHSDPRQKVVVPRGQEAILTADAIIGPRPVPLDEIKRRVRWRERYQFLQSGVDWGTVGAVAVGLAVVGAGIALGTSGGRNDPPPTSPGSGTSDGVSSPSPSPAPTSTTPFAPLGIFNFGGSSTPP